MGDRDRKYSNQSMSIILFTTTSKRAGSLNLGRPQVFVPALISLLLIVAGLLYAGFRFGSHSTEVQQVSVIRDDWRKEVSLQRSELEEAKLSADRHLNALAMRLGQMQAQMIRLDALGQRLTKAADLDEGEFNFDQLPAQGGPVSSLDQPANGTLEFPSALHELSRQLEDRERQMSVLEDLIMSRDVEDQVRPAGRPLKRGWLSSYYGWRTDPFTGRRDFHSGVDFAGKFGSDVVAVAAGVVTESKQRSGYGDFVEIDHGNGIVTRYGHNSKNLVKVGDAVKKGQRIALMGSSGRSTGPHVHFEVLRHGKTVNPAKYIRAAR